MRHQKSRHKLSRDASHRKALLANLCIEVIDHERIKTTEAKAKAVKPEIEKLITLARKGDLHARRRAISILQHPDKRVIYKLFDEIAPRYAERPGGYNRILARPTPSPFEAGRALWWPHPLDVPALEGCAAALLGTHDFTAFTPTETYHQRFERDVLRAEWQRSGDVLEFWIEADTFMRHMNRV